MSSFKDTFTKEEGQDTLLGYDDQAFYYFACTVLLCIALPWTFSVVKNLILPGKAQVEKDFPKKSRTGKVYRYCQSSEMVQKIDVARREARRCSSSGCVWLVLKIAILSSLWLFIILCVQQVGTAGEIKKFDPFAILEIESNTPTEQIKKAYKKLALKLHPDKNPDDPEADQKFMQITKAYNALTDEDAKRNYEKYGNPDGPTSTKVGIGLPRFLLEKDNHLMILCIFFFVLLFMVPMTFICYYQRTKNYAANGVMIETLQFLGHYILETTRAKNCPELIAASAESRNMPLHAADNTEMKPLMEHVTEHKKRQFNMPIIIRNSVLLWAHQQRLHHLMSPALREDCDQLLKYSMRITQAMIEIACMREWFYTAQSMIEFRRQLVQALDIKSSQLLQVPHFTEEHIKHCHRGKNAVSTLADFVSRDAEQRKGIARMEPHQLCDIEAFSAHVSDMEVKAVIEVEDEAEIVVGDVATVTVTLRRRNLRENEAIGPVHAPLFPEPKFEEWWVFLVEATKMGGEAAVPRIITFERIRDTGPVVEEKLRFQVGRPGKWSLVLHALCDSYAGIDQKVELNFNAQQEGEVKREIVVHPEDEELDLQPTLFQQFMGELNRGDDESEEEEEEEAKKKPPRVQERKEDSGEDEDDKKEAAAKDDDDDSSDSSSSASGD